jgi:hypothetical protein
MSLSILKDVLGRMIALFITSAAGVVTGAAVFAPDVSVATSCLLAGSAAVVQVLQKLAAASIDGNLTKEEVDAAFGIKAETRAAHQDKKAEGK